MDYSPGHRMCIVHVYGILLCRIHAHLSTLLICFEWKKNKTYICITMLIPLETFVSYVYEF